MTELGPAFEPPPAAAAWSHRDARTGFEVVYPVPDGDGWRLTGCATAVEDGATWVVEYEVTVDAGWVTRAAVVRGRSAAGARSTRLDTDGAGHWRVDGTPRPDLDGCRDVDLEASALTNALPVHRLGLPVGGVAAAPAAYVRALGLGVERLEQTYVRIDDDPDGGGHRYDYASPAFDFSCRLVYDRAGLVLAYPGIAVRAA